jgi:hypothetical protein
MTENEPKVDEIPATRNVSYSQYTCWSTCPWQWKLKYVDGFREESNINLIFGTAIHDTIQHWLKLYYGDSPVQAKVFDMHEMLKDRLISLATEKLIAKGLTTKEELMEYYLDGCNILDHMRQHAKDWFPSTGYVLKGVEVPLLKDLGNNITFKGFIDVAVYHKTAKMLYIYDFKTSGRGWSDYQKKDTAKTDQLLLYKMFYSELFGIPLDSIKVEFIILKRKVFDGGEYKVKHIAGFEPSHGKPSLKKARERFDRFLTEAFNPDGTVRLDNLKATPSDSSCKFCPFNNDATKCNFSVKLKSGRKITKAK